MLWNLKWTPGRFRYSCDKCFDYRFTHVGGSALVLKFFVWCVYVREREFVCVCVCVSACMCVSEYVLTQCFFLFTCFELLFFQGMCVMSITVITR